MKRHTPKNEEPTPPKPQVQTIQKWLQQSSPWEQVLDKISKEKSSKSASAESNSKEKTSGT